MTELKSATGSGSRSGYLKIVGVALALVVLAFVAKSHGGDLAQLVERVRDFGMIAPVIVVAGYAVATVAMVPVSLVTIAIGAVYGVWVGSLLVFVGAMLGLAAAFLIGRRLGREAIDRRLRQGSRAAAIDRAIAGGGWKVVLLLRLSPVIPFTPLNYILGVTRLRFRDYLLGSVAILPGTMLYCYAGELAGSLAGVRASSSLLQSKWILGVGILATIGVVALITLIAKRQLERTTDLVDPTNREGTT